MTCFTNGANRTDHQPWPTGHIENDILLFEVNRLQRQAHRVLVGVLMLFRKWNRLAGELVENDIVVGVGHDYPLKLIPTRASIFTTLS